MAVALQNFNNMQNTKVKVKKLTKSEKIIISRLLNIADYSDFFQDNIPDGCKTLEDTWVKIASIRKKLDL